MPKNNSRATDDEESDDPGLATGDDIFIPEHRPLITTESTPLVTQPTPE